VPGGVCSGGLPRRGGLSSGCVFQLAIRMVKLVYTFGGGIFCGFEGFAIRSEWMTAGIGSSVEVFN